MAKNKFLPDDFDPKKARQLKRVLEPLQNTALSVEGAVRMLDDMISRSSTIRKCDVKISEGIFESMRRLETK